MKSRRSFKSYLLDLETSLARYEVTRDWTMDELEVALRSLKNNKARHYLNTGDMTSKFHFLEVNAGKNIQLFFILQQSPAYGRKKEINQIVKIIGAYLMFQNSVYLDKFIYNDIYTNVD